MSKTWNALHWVAELEKGGSRAADSPDLLRSRDGEGRLNRPQPILESSTADEDAIVPCDFSKIDQVTASGFSRIVCHTDPTGPGADRFRLLRMRLRLLRSAGRLKSILITSPLPEDGKTTVGLNTATILTEQKTKNVLLIDCDLHRRGVQEHIGLERRKGIAECIESGLDPMSAICRVEPFGFYLLTAGEAELVSPTESLRPSVVSQVLHKLLPHFEWVLIDSPPVLPLTDALSLAQVTDGTLLVTRAGQTPSKALDDSIELIGKKRIVGLVVNGAEGAGNPYSKYQGYYRSSKPSDAGSD